MARANKIPDLVYEAAPEIPSLIQEPLSHKMPKPRTDNKGRLWCPLMNNGAGGWREPKPEEIVRQAFILHLHEHYGYSFEQMLDEQRTQTGRRSSKADIAIWETAAERNRDPRPSPRIIVECKAENIDIHPHDFYQGESYARATGADLLVMHNERQTHIYTVTPGIPGGLTQINLLPGATDWGNAKEIERIKNSLRVFDRKTFQDLLFRCHSILRDNHKMEPGAAFDAISKVLFIKMYIERTGTWGTFSEAFLNQRKATLLPNDAPVHEQLFSLTKRHYAADEIFSERDALEISEETFRRIVRELQRFNLSATSDDIKGLAFEKFLGATFRGNLGQFFTPRPVVNFIVEMLDPVEGQLICDPACGSGGFLIRAFEHIRSRIEAEIQAKKDAARAEIEAQNLNPDIEEQKIDAAFAELNVTLDPEHVGARIHTLAHSRIYGTDAEARSARTAKMNMIMHGDGHGGIHFHDGLLDINGIFAGRFDLVLTNPPFGSNVGDDQKVGATEQSRLPSRESYVADCRAKYAGELAHWEQSHARITAAAQTSKKVLDLFEIGKDKPNRATEIVFLERCIQLLKPGGRLGIVLPDGNLNNPSLSWLRRWAEGHTRLLAVVSLPEDVFKASDTTAKTSIVFLQKFTAADTERWATLWKEVHAAHDSIFAARREKIVTDAELAVVTATDPELATILAEAAVVGLRRALPKPRLKAPPPYPRGIVQTEIGKPSWVAAANEAPPETAEEKKKAVEAKKKRRELRTMFEAAWTDAHEERSEELRRELRVALRKLDREHSRTLWAEVRELFDYPVFTAAPENAGITSTGDTGEHVPNDFPAILAAWRQFDAWVQAGAEEKVMPQFDSAL